MAPLSQVFKSVIKFATKVEERKDLGFVTPPTVEDIGITVNKTIRTKYSKGWQDKKRTDALGKKIPISEVVIHGTGGGNTIEGILQWMYDGEFAANYVKGIGLFHYLIGNKGDIVEIIDPEYWTYHSTSGYNDRRTIGIELFNSSKSNRDPYTKEQYESLFKLIFKYLIPLYPTITNITSHRANILTYNNGKGLKQCPGPEFSWEKLDSELKSQGYTFETKGDLRFKMEKSA